MHSQILDDSLIAKLGERGYIRLLEESLFIACKILVTTSIPALSSDAISPEVGDKITEENAKLFAIDIIRMANSKAPSAPPEGEEKEEGEETAPQQAPEEVPPETPSAEVPAEAGQE